MNPEDKNKTDMLSSQILSSADPYTATHTSALLDKDDDDHTATGIPISLLWMPYVGFSLCLILLMLVSFLHYHRKHGHKYHHRQQFWGQEMTVSNVLGNISGQITSIGKRAGTDNSDGRFRRKDSKDGPSRSKAIGYRGVEEYVPPTPPAPQQLPPNGGLQISRNSKAEILDSSGQVFLKSSQPHSDNPRRSLPVQPLTNPATNPRPGHRARPRNAHCDEPSTSSSTVSSKTSNQSIKPGGGGRNRYAHGRRPKRPLIFEANENGSMVDIRVNLKEDAQTTETIPLTQELPMQNNSFPKKDSSIEMAQKYNTANRYNTIDHYEVNPAYRNPDSQEGYRRKLPPNPTRAPPTDLCGSYPNNLRGKYKDRNPDEYSLYQDRSSRSTSLPIWTTMPLHPKPPAPRRDFYSYPFTPSGHMEMLSDTENDEVFLLQHTKL